MIMDYDLTIRCRAIRRKHLDENGSLSGELLYQPKFATAIRQAENLCVKELMAFC
jgi:hypothetical protein